MTVIGLDIGTSGVRAVALDPAGTPVAWASAPLPAPQRDGAAVRQDPWLWWDAVQATLARLSADLRGPPPVALGLDGTSGTLLLAHPDGRPLGPARLYNDQSATAEAARIAAIAPAASPAQGAGSSLARLLALLAEHRPRGPVLALHQADWIGGMLRGDFQPDAAGHSDWHNALKLGFDPAALAWPDWLAEVDLAPARLPRCHAPGADLGPIDPEVAARTGLPTGLRIHAGTTDSTAATLAAGPLALGDAVTSLGSTLVLKVCSPTPVNAPAWGVYSHRLGDLWLVGGASNSGGAVLSAHFTDTALATLSARIDPSRDSGLDYYPLPAPGERFPVSDPTLPPRLTPRPPDDAQFLHGLLEGIARIERDGYARLTALGAPAPRRVLTLGGGARNPQWQALRARLLGLPVTAAVHQEAAIGAARLARGPLGAGRTCLAATDHHPDHR